MCLECEVRRHALSGKVLVIVFGVCVLKMRLPPF